MTTTAFTPYTAWPVLETLAHKQGFSGLNPEFLQAVHDRADESGEPRQRTVYRMAYNAGLNGTAAATQYTDFMNGMRRLLAPAR